MSIFANKKDLELAQENIATLETDLSALQSDLTEAQSTVSTHCQTIADLTTNVSTITAERDTLQAEITAAQATIATLQESLTTAETSANARAIEIASQAGLAPLDVANDEPTPINHLEHMKNLSPAEKTAYVKKNKKAIQAQLTK